MSNRQWFGGEWNELWDLVNRGVVRRPTLMDLVDPIPPIQRGRIEYGRPVWTEPEVKKWMDESLRKRERENNVARCEIMVGNFRFEANRNGRIKFGKKVFEDDEGKPVYILEFSCPKSIVVTIEVTEAQAQSLFEDMGEEFEPPDTAVQKSEPLIDTSPRCSVVGPEFPKGSGMQVVCDLPLNHRNGFNLENAEYHSWMGGTVRWHVEDREQVDETVPFGGRRPMR